jgi:hypothetical protein
MSDAWIESSKMASSCDRLKRHYLIEVEAIFDTQRNHYQIVHLGWQHKRWVHHCVMHLDIRNEKIWIFSNSTEHDIAADLVNLGVPKQDIVLGFYPPFMGEMSDYAVG